jgi:hypothetical protein
MGVVPLHIICVTQYCNLHCNKSPLALPETHITTIFKETTKTANVTCKIMNASTHPEAE